MTGTAILFEPLPVGRIGVYRESEKVVVAMKEFGRAACFSLSEGYDDQKQNTPGGIYFRMIKRLPP